jgi:hypothetical protein
MKSADESEIAPSALAKDGSLPGKSTTVDGTYFHPKPGGDLGVVRNDGATHVRLFVGTSRLRA